MPETETLAGYDLLAKLARGGMAEIWIARPKSSTEAVGAKEVCVVKKLLKEHEGKEDFVQMFLDEGRIGKRMTHPNIVRIFDVGFDAPSDTHFLSMEYLHGEDLRTIIRTLRSDKKRMPLGLALRVVIEVCSALDHAHELKAEDGTTPLGLVHRDVSPHNVVVTFDGNVKLVDFGIAKTKDRDWQTKHGTLKGKVPYMAPEQIRAKVLDRRTDVYALGVVLYEAVIGKRPYVLTAPGEFATMMAIARGDIAAPTTVDPELPKQLEQIILRAIAHKPEHRYPTTKALATDLISFVKAEKVDISASSLSSFIRKLFGAHAEKWRAATLEKTDLAAHVVEIEHERAAKEAREDAENEDVTELYVAVSTGTGTAPKTSAVVEPPSSAPMIVANVSHTVASVAELLGVTVVSLHGRLDESFAGAKLAETLRGRQVLFDLKAIERVTSFGVREWIEMVRVLGNEGVEVWVSRCPEPVVTQMCLVPAFLGKTKLASFDASFLCDDCGMSFARMIDCEGDGDLILGERAAITTCTQCGGRARLDDEPGFLSFAAPFAKQTIPGNVRTLMTTLDDRDRAAGDIISKLVTENETRLYVRREVDESFRWARVLDGIEGRVVIDFRNVTRLSKPAAESFARAMRGLGREVSMCSIVEAPAPIALTLAPQGKGRRFELSSVAFEGRCESCLATRTGVATLEELKTPDPHVACRRCNGRLIAPEILEVVEKYRAGANAQPELVVTPLPVPVPVSAPASASVLALTPRKIEVTSSSAVEIHHPPLASSRRPQKTLWVIGGALSVLLLVGGGIAVRSSLSSSSGRVSEQTPRETTSAAPTASANGTAPTPSDDGSLQVSVTARASNEDEAARRARRLAVVDVLVALEKRLPPAVRDVSTTLPLIQNDEKSVADRFDREIGARASIERQQCKALREGNPMVVTLTCGYRMSESAIEVALEYYGATQTLAGGALTVSPVLPIRGEGQWVVLSTTPRFAEAGVTVGARVALNADGRRATIIDARNPSKKSEIDLGKK